MTKGKNAFTYPQKRIYKDESGFSIPESTRIISSKGLETIYSNVIHMPSDCGYETAIKRGGEVDNQQWRK